MTLAHSYRTFAGGRRTWATTVRSVSRCRGSTPRYGTLRGSGPDSRSTACLAARTKPESRPTPACCASTHPRTSARPAQLRSPAVMAKQLTPFKLSWVEEPSYPPDDHAGLARVRREGGIPTAAGENLGNINDFR